MPISPVLPTSGLTGWRFLNDSLETQETLFNSSPDISRDVDYFNENIGDIKTLDDFMGDRRILKVALGAFGLGDEINKGAFVRKVLEEGTEDRSAFAVRLNNSDYLEPSICQAALLSLILIAKKNFYPTKRIVFLEKNPSICLKTQRRLKRQ